MTSGSIDPDGNFSVLDVNTGEIAKFHTDGIQRDADGNLTLEITRISDDDDTTS